MNRLPTAVLALAGALAVAVVALPSCRSDEGGLVRINPKTFDAADEAAIGRRLGAELWRDADLVLLEPEAGSFTDGAYRYLAPLLSGLTEQGHVTRRDSFAWAVTLVLDEDPRAYTLPGGQIYVHTGLLYALDNEAELVGVLAREIALAEQGAAMAALDRQVEDNVTLGDLILGNVVPLDHVVQALPAMSYTAEELGRADSLAARLVCQSDYEERALATATARLAAGTSYGEARPLPLGWRADFESRVGACPGADSLYVRRYRATLRTYVPN